MKTSTYLGTRGAAKYLGEDGEGGPLISPKTLERWRTTGEGPAFCKLGRRVVYRTSDLDDWAESRIRRSTTDEGEAA